MTHEEAFSNAERAGVDGVFTRVDATHPVGIYLGIESGKRTMMVVCPTEPPEMPSLAAIEIEARHRQAGDWALMFRLEHRDLRLLFARLVEDLEEATRARPERPGETVCQRLHRWQKLLARRQGTRLDDRALRGLAAELCFLRDEAVPAWGPDSATQAWRGPFDAAKDFVWPSVEVEVKALYRSGVRILVSSLDQLSDAGVPLYLWSKVVDLAAAGDVGAVSAAVLVEQVRTAVSSKPLALERFEEALRSAGYVDGPEYEGRYLYLGDSACYAVRNEFPRIQRAEVATGVIDATYELRVGDLGAFAVSGWLPGGQQ